MAMNGQSEVYEYKQLNVFAGTSELKATFVFKWTVISQDIANATSTIRWSVEATTEAGVLILPTSFINNTSATVYINDNRVYIKTTSKDYTFEEIPQNSTGVLISGTHTITHTNTQPQVFTYSVDAEFIVKTGSGSTSTNKILVELEGSGEIDGINNHAQFTSAPDFTDEENPTVSYVAPSGYIMSVWVALSFDGVNDDIPYREVSLPPATTDEGSYTFNLTEAERETLRTKLDEGTVIPIYYLIKSLYHTEVSDNVNSKRATLTFINYEPVLNPTVKDVNARTLRVSGDENTFIRYFSNAQFATGAEGRKGATITNQYVKNGDVIAGNVYEGIIEGITSNTFYFSATDNRDYTTRDAIVVSFIPYIKLTCNVKTEELTALGELTVKVSGKYYNGSFGKMNNSLELEYGLTENDGDIEWHPLGAVNPTVDNEGNYSYTFTITGLNHESRYTLIVNAIDEVMPQPSTAYKVIATIPVFDWGENDFKHYTDVYLEPGKSLRATSAAGKDMELVAVSDNGSVDIGYGNYVDNEGTTTIYGNEVNILTNGSFTINGTTFGESQVLWEGAHYMNGNQTAQLSQSIAQQSHGIVLVFSLYRNGAAADASFNTFYISKKEVALLPNAPHTFLLGINSGFSVIGAKYLYIDNNVITGNATNTSSGTNSGITFDNSQFVLRYVIGV